MRRKQEIGVLTLGPTEGQLPNAAHTPSVLELLLIAAHTFRVSRLRSKVKSRDSTACTVRPDCRA